MTDTAPAGMAGRPGLATPIPIALIGCGNIALAHHVPAYLAMPDLVRVVAIADPTPDRRAAGAALLGLGPDDVGPDADAVIARDDVAAVDISTPPHVRTPIALAALRAGKAVLCEKPLAILPRDAAALAATSAATGVPLGIVHNYLYFPEIVRAGRIIESGEIGEPRVVTVDFLGVHDRPGTAAYRPGWRHEAALAGGGVLMDMMHAIYVAETLLGHPIVRVSAHIQPARPGDTVEGLALCRVETDRGTGLVNVGWGHGPGGIAVTGSKGRIEIRYEHGGTSPFAPLEWIAVVDHDGHRRVETIPADPDEGSPAVFLRATLRDFFERLADRRSPRSTASDGAHVLEVVLGAYASAAQGRTVSLPLAPDDPTFLHGVAGVASLAGPSWNPVRRLGMFAPADS